MTDFPVSNDLLSGVEYFWVPDKFKIRPSDGKKVWEYPKDSGEWRTASEIRQIQETVLAKQAHKARSPLNVMRNYSPGHAVGLYNPLSGTTEYDPLPNSNEELNGVRALAKADKAEFKRVAQQVRDERSTLQEIREFDKWLDRVLKGLLDDGCTDEERAKQKIAAQNLRDTYDETHRLMGGWIRLPDGHEVREDGPSVANMKRLLRDNPKQKTFPCPIDGTEFERKELIKILQTTIEELK